MWSHIGLLPQCLFIVRSRAKVNRLKESYVSRAAQRSLGGGSRCSLKTALYVSTLLNTWHCYGRVARSCQDLFISSRMSVFNWNQWPGLNENRWMVFTGIRIKSTCQ